MLDDDFEDDETEQEEYKSGIRSTIRAKGIMDGATTLTGAAELLRQTATEILTLEAQGWQLPEPVEDDYGFIRRAPSPEPAATG